MNTLITTACLFLILGFLTVLQILIMSRRWAIREAEFAKKWDLSRVFELKPLNIEPIVFSPAGQIDPMREIAEKPTPGLDRLEAELAATANDPEATDEQFLPPDSSTVA